MDLVILETMLWKLIQTVEVGTRDYEICNVVKKIDINFVISSNKIAQILRNFGGLKQFHTTKQNQILETAPFVNWVSTFLETHISFKELAPI